MCIIISAYQGLYETTSHVYRGVVLVVILVSISLAMSLRPRTGDLRASMRLDQEEGGSVLVNQCSSMPVKQAPATSR